MTENVQLLTVMAFGLAGSLGHCIGMCGGFIVTYTSTKISSDTSKVSQALYHLLYNGGRISSYTILGALFGAFGAIWEATPLMRAVMFAVAGLLMILMGLSLTGKIRFLNSIEYNLTNTGWYRRLFGRLIGGQSKRSFFLLGMLNGIFPCGLVYAALVWAMTTGSILGGAAVMFLFGISTLPALFGFGFFVGLLKQTAMRKVMLQLSALIVIAFGGWTLYKSYLQYERHLNPPKSGMHNCQCH